MNALTQRKIAKFKANKRGYVAFWLFCLVVLLSLPAEFIANDRPIVIKYKNNWYMPVLNDYYDSEFGGDFDTPADYKDPYIRKQIEANGWMLMPPIPWHYDTINYNLARAPSPPSSENWLGVDDQGRDVLARVIYGLRLSILFALTLSVISSAIGIIAGAIQGFYGGWTDLLFQRVIEIWHGVPVLYILIIIGSILEPTIYWLFLILLAFSWMDLVGVVRAEVLKARNYDYVRAARALGVREIVIMWRHVMPNAMVAALTFLPFIINGAITTLTALDFLGFGLPPGTASLGDLLAQAKANPTAPWLGITAVFALAILLSLLIFISEAVRDAFDPRKNAA